MAPRTLYDVVRPICFTLKLFGLNFGSEEAEGCWWKMYKLIVRCVLAYQIWKIMLRECSTPSTYSIGHIMILNLDLLLICGVGMHFFCLKEGEMKGLMKRFKQHPLGKMSQKTLNEQLIPFKIFSTFFAIFIFIFTSAFCADAMLSFKRFFKNKSNFFLLVIRCFYVESALFTLLFPIFPCILPCIVACYCRAEMDEAMEEMKRMKSLLRRAKASAKLIDKYQQLYELASDTDRALSTAMYVIKWPFLIAIATSFMMFKHIFTLPGQSFDFATVFLYLCSLGLLFSFLIYFPLLQYLYLAPAANQMVELMNKTIGELQLMDDQCLSRDPLSRPCLLNMKMKQIERLNYVATEDQPFTMFGNIADSDVAYIMILEMIDMWNILSAHASEDEMTINRIYRTFMWRCMDCAYWTTNS